MALYVNDGGSWRQPKTAYVNDGGNWKQLKALWVNNNGVWIQVAPTPGSQLFTASGTFTVPSGVTQMKMTAIGGGAGAGNMVDGGANDDSGGGGGGSSGQYVSNYTIPVTPGEVISVTIGAGGANAGTGWGSGNQGGAGGQTTIVTAAKTYYLLGGIGGYGGPGQNILYSGGTQTTSNTSLTGVAVNQGGNATYYVGGSGGAGITGSAQPGQYYSQAGGYHTELDAVNYGGGGAAGYYGYLRQDQGKHPGWGGTGKAGVAYFSWGSQQTFTTVGTTTFTVPNFVTTLTVNAAGGGGGGGYLTDSGCNSDYGTAGGGSSGQIISGYSLAVTPGQVLTITVGAGGSQQSAGGNTVVGSLTLKGGNGGPGGECCNGVFYPGASVPTGGPTGYFGYAGGSGVGTNKGGNGYGNTGGGTAGPYISHHGWGGQSGGNGTAYGAGGGGGASSDNNSGGFAGGGNGYQGFVQLIWS